MSGRKEHKRFPTDWSYHVGIILLHLHSNSCRFPNSNEVRLVGLLGVCFRMKSHHEHSHQPLICAKAKKIRSEASTLVAARKTPDSGFEDGDRNENPTQIFKILLT